MLGHRNRPLANKGKAEFQVLLPPRLMPWPWEIWHSKSIFRGFPGGAVVGNPPANVGDTGSSTGRSHVPQSNWAHASQLLTLCSAARGAQLLSPHATAAEACTPKACALHTTRSHCNERSAHRNEEWPPLAATGESPCTATKTQHSQK